MVEEVILKVFAIYVQLQFVRNNKSKKQEILHGLTLTGATGTLKRSLDAFIFSVQFSNGFSFMYN